MLGVVHQELHRFVQVEAGEAARARVLEAAGVPDVSYVSSVTYSDDEVPAVFVALAKETGTGVGELITRFGRFLAPALIDRYRMFLEDSWRTIDLVDNTERIIHRAVRVNEPTATPPRLTTQRTGAAEVRVIYTSPRRLCRLARGLIEGVAAHYGDSVSVVDAACVFTGDERCELVVTAH